MGSWCGAGRGGHAEASHALLLRLANVAGPELAIAGKQEGADVLHGWGPL